MLSSGRQPPDLQGVSLAPRIRKIAAMAVAPPTATKDRRNNLITPSLVPCCKTPLVGLTGFEPVTSPLSGVRSNLLSYSPVDCPQE